MPPKFARSACALLLLALSSSCGSGAEGEAVPWDSEPSSDAQISSFTGVDASVSQSPVSTGPGSIPASSPISSTSTSGTTPSQSSGSTSSASRSDAGTSSSASRDAGATSGGNAIDDLIGGLFGADDAGTKSSADAGTNSSAGDAGTSGEWKLEPDSAEECPPEPPPIPIVGGACLGLYYTCNWKNAAGETYFCTCDWVHWLCI